MLPRNDRTATSSSVTKAAELESLKNSRLLTALGSFEVFICHIKKKSAKEMGLYHGLNSEN
jgi:hypothetical protein